MKNIGIVILLFLLQLFCTALFAQYADHRNRQVDSLEQVLATNPPTGKELMVVYDNLTWGYLEINAEKSMNNARKLILMCIPLDSWSGVARSYRALGINFYMLSQYDSAMVYYDKALEATERMKNFPKRYNDASIDNELSLIYGSLGNLYNIQGKNHEAIEYYQMASKIFEKYDWKESQSIVHQNIGEMYLAMDNYEQAKINFSKLDSLAHIIDDSFFIATAKKHFTALYLQTKEYDKALQNAEIAYNYYFSHSEEEGGNKAVIMNYLSEIYLEGYGDLAKAEAYVRQALTLSDTLDIPREQSVSLCILSTIYLKRGEWRKAEQTALEALVADDSEPANTLALYGILAKAYAHLGNPAKAAEYFDKHNELQSSWATKHYQSAIREMEVKYETEKKEHEIERQQNIINRTNLQRGMLAITTVVLLLGLAMALLLWRWTVQKRRLAEQQVKQLEQEKQLIATQSVLDGEIQERTRLARDLHDGLGSMLTGVKFNLETLKNNVIFAPNDVKNFDNAMSILANSMLEMRRVAHNLMPDSLTRFGLKVALKDFCHHFPVIEFAWFGSEERLPDLNRELMIYRIIHELVNNALKHSGATKITVNVMSENDYIAFTVYDNGCGFDSERQTQGMGLRNIRERVAACNGRMELDTGAGKGTEINVEFRY